MFRHTFSLFIALAFTLSLTSCYYLAHPREQQEVELTTPAESHNYELSMPTQIIGISVHRGIEVNYSYGEKPRLAVTTNLQDTSLINIEVQDGMLVLTYDKQLRNTDNVETLINITGQKNISLFETTSAARLSLTQPEFENLALTSSSGSSISLYLGEGRSVKANSSSGGQIAMERVGLEELYIGASSGATFQLVQGNISQQLAVEASSGASVTLSGKAKLIHYDASSGAAIDATHLQGQIGKTKVSSGADLSCSPQ